MKWMAGEAQRKQSRCGYLARNMEITNRDGAQQRSLTRQIKRKIPFEGQEIEKMLGQKLEESMMIGPALVEQIRTKCWSGVCGSKHLR